MALPQSYVTVSRRPPDVEDYIDMLRRYRSWIIGPMFLGLVGSTVIAFLWPDTFVSKAVAENHAAAGFRAPGTGGIHYSDHAAAERDGAGTFSAAPRSKAIITGSVARTLQAPADAASHGRHRFRHAANDIEIRLDPNARLRSGSDNRADGDRVFDFLQLSRTGTRRKPWCGMLVAKFTDQNVTGAARQGAPDCRISSKTK